MRIIAGKYRSRKIWLPKGSFSKKGASLRPTSDRARETLFDVLSIEADFENSVCLDLYAGTGALGFEALSRGAGSAAFVDLSPKNLEAIKRTAEELGCRGQIYMFKEDSLHYLRGNQDKTFDFIFADPPYDYNKYNELTELVIKMRPILFALETSSSRDWTFASRGYAIREKKVGSAKFSIFISK